MEALKIIVQNLKAKLGKAEAYLKVNGRELLITTNYDKYTPNFEYCRLKDVVENSETNLDYGYMENLELALNSYDSFKLVIETFGKYRYLSKKMKS